MSRKGENQRFDPFTCPLDGAHVVEASAGTGKTFSLSWVVTRLVIERGVPIDGILVVTFTNAATAELVGAVRERLKSAAAFLSGDAREDAPPERDYLRSLGDPARATSLARAALTDIDRAAISSIHGFCQRTLSERAFESGVPFDAEVAEDDSAFCGTVAEDFWSREVYGATRPRVEALAQAKWTVGRAHRIAAILARDPEAAFVPAADPVVREVDGRAVAFVKDAFAARRAASKALSFNDLLYELDRALSDGSRGERLAEALRDRYHAALVDEFQDTNAVQYRIFRRIFRDAGKPFFAFGDPKQAIYRFRGGDVFTYLRAAAEPGARRWSLDVNHRSDEGVVRAVNALFGGEDPFLCGGRIALSPASVRTTRAGRRPLTERGEPRPPFEILRADPDAIDEPDVARGIAADIEGLLASDVRCERRVDGAEEPEAVRIRARDVAVLTRTNAQAGDVAEALRRRGVAASTTSDASVFRTDEARYLAQLLGGVREPADPARIATAICSPLFGVPATDIREVSRGGAACAAWSRRMEALGRAFRGGGPVALVSGLLSLDAVGGRPLAAELFSRARGETIASRLRHLTELAQARPRAGGDDLRELAEWLDRGRRGASAEEGAQLRPETDGDAVTVMTVHKAKGLEFPVVYVPYASRRPGWRDRGEPVEYHDPEREDAAFVDLGSAAAGAHLALSRAEEEAEETRLLYVAVTRARHLVKLVWLPPVRRQRPGPADVLLRALPADPGAPFRISELPSPDAAGGPAREPREAPRIAPPKVTALASARSRGSFSRLVEGYEAEEGTAGRAEEPPGGDAEVPLAGFPAGTDPGTTVHGIMSSIDFCDADRAPLDRAAAAAVRRYGLEPAWTARLADALRDALETPLDPGGAIRLRGIPRRERLDEVRFSIAAPGGRRPARATIGDLSDAIGAGEGDAWATECAARARDLPDGALADHLSGAIDLVFRSGDVFYVADYKTNRLGTRFDDYLVPRLEREMLDRHYYLQYHLYALAVHRYLASRVADYSYGARFGGVFYLFLRGMSRERGAKSGVFFSRPHEASIRALDALFGGGGAP